MGSHFVPLKTPSSFHRWAAAQWRRPNDPSMYGSSRIDMTQPLEFLGRVREDWGVKVTVTHLVAKALAVAIARHPETNTKVRFWGKLEQRQSVDIIVLVAGEGGRDLSAHRITAADTLPLKQLATDVIAAAERIRRDDDAKFKQSRALVSRLPWWLMRPFLSLASLCMNELHIDLSRIGLPVDLFGAGMVTSLGMYGIDEGYPPLTPIGRIMVDILVPRIKDDVWVENGAMVIRPTLKLCATFDHRVIDGVQAATLAREIQSLLSVPESLI
jgi:pyruvate/2-oxoglutarate dehydrogenase complex dihydrolipoamide acyltransferase (E2) component